MLVKKSFASSDLKIIAMISMFIDHAAVFMSYVNGDGLSPVGDIAGTAMRLLGRVAFPLYAFMLVQGFFHTRSQIRYFMRLAVLAAVSEIPFDLVRGGSAFYPELQSTALLLCIGLLALMGIDFVRKTAAAPGAKALLVAGAAMAAAEIFKTDYGVFGILFILILYLLPSPSGERTGLGVTVMIICEGVLFGLFVWIAFFFMNRYNGTRGKDMRYLPYVFYPAHLLIIFFAGEFIHGIYF